MESALEQAKIGMQKNEIPVGAVIFDSSKKEVISMAHNMVEELRNPLMHAEMIALNKAFEIKKSKYLDNCFIYVTLEPCVMCMNAILKSRVDKLYYAASDNKNYPLEQCYLGKKNIHNTLKKSYNNDILFSQMEIYGNIMEHESISLLKQFFYGIRNDTEFNF
jgi:tRNA(Arg) A34 adenosine deaminase TadA